MFMFMFMLSPSNKHKEMQLINTILRNNGYPPHTYTHKQVTNKITNTVQQQQKQKWATFTYTGNQTRAITKLFKNSNIRIAYRTNNAIHNYLQNKDHNSDKYSHSGIYELKCNSCQLKYIGQTDGNFRVRYKEHIHAIRSNKTTSRYAQHILETGHTYGTIENTLNTLKFERKSQKMNSLEQYYIYRLTKENLQLNDTYTNNYNPIFHIIADYYK
jgi:hypothetical protein